MIIMIILHICTVTLIYHLASQISDSSLCTKFVQKGTPHCNCTSSKRCLPADAFMDGQEDCPDGEDEGIFSIVDNL